MISKILAGGAVLASLVAGSAGAASASTHHPAYHPHKMAVASVEVNGEGFLQYQKFVALSGFGHYHGYESYTNDGYAMPGSGVWSLANKGAQLTVKVPGNTYTHTLNSGATITAVGPEHVKFAGSGYWNANSNDTWTVAGDVKGDNVKMVLTYGSWAVPPYSATDTGTIASDGSASGTFKDSAGTTGTWSLPAGTFFEVLHFVAPIQYDKIQVGGQNVSITFTIPATWNGAPVPYATHVLTLDAHNGGTPAADTFSQGVDHGHQVPETVSAGHIAAFNW